METASIPLICFYDGDLINENKNAEYVGGKKKLNKVSKTIGFKEFKEKIQAMLGLQPDDSEFTIKCGVYLNKEIQITIDVDDDEPLSSILEQFEFIVAYIIKRQSSVINTHRREANGLRNVEKETIGGGGGVDPPNEMDPRGNFLQSMEQPLLPASTDVNLHGSSNFVKCECVFRTSYECTHDHQLALKRKLPELNCLSSTLMIKPSKLVADKGGPKKKKLSKHENSTKMDQSGHEFTNNINDSEWLPDEASSPFEESYQYLPGLIKELEKSGCVTKLSCDKENRFLYFFWAFRQCVHALHAHLCSPLIQIKSKRIQSGVLMTANGIAWDKPFYLAFAIFKEEEEDEVCWETFLMLLKEFILADVHLRLPFAIVTEFGRKTTVSLVSKVFPEVHHVFDLDCLYKDFYDKFKDDNLCRLMLKAAKMFNVSDCDGALNEIKEKNEDAYQWLLDAGKSHWSNAYFPVGYDFNYNSSRGWINWDLECFTEDIEHLPIAAAVIHITKRMVFFDEQAVAATLPTKLTSLGSQWVDLAINDSHLFRVVSLGINAEEYHAFEVTEFHHFTVNLKTRTCDCGEFQGRGLPCKHAAAVINQLDRNIEDYCKHWHKKEAIRAICAEDFLPLANHSKDWQPPEDNEPRILPPKKKVGRPGKAC